ncbi:MAG: alpha/beta fold hydrolase [Bacilli bacterium]|nr:alpha/beta fold hydrolase [Bacilli bacterium]
MLNEIKYQSKDNITEIHAVMWIPTTKVNAIIQIEHGMSEYIKRYEGLAEILNEKGILVCGEDHLGHGESVIDSLHYGYIAAKRGDRILVDDAITLTEIMKKQYPNVPYYLLGHSFGSFIARNYIAKSDDINGIIMMGSSYQSSLKMNLAIMLAAIEQFYHHGWFYHSKLLHKLTIGKYQKYFEDKRKYSWLTKNEEVMTKMENDPLCNIDFTCNGYLNMFRLIKQSNKKKTYKNTNKDLPILIMSGNDDPVGNFKTGVLKIDKLYKKAKFNNVKLKVYNGMRHNLLDEPERIIAINDIILFINTNNLKVDR